MKRRYEIAMATIGFGTAALGAVALGGPSHTSEPTGPSQATEPTACVGVTFASPKGGPGAIQMRVFPEFNRNFGDARVMTVDGRVVGGNDNNTPISTPPEAAGYGQYTFTWDTSETATQSSDVSIDVDYEDGTYRCPTTTMHFDPTSYEVTPHLEDSPY